MEVTLKMYLIVLPLVFLASGIDAVAGGGGLISLPAYLAAGLPPVYAAGSNKLSGSFGTLLATLKYLKNKKLMLLPALCAAAGAFPGAYLGAELLKRLPERFVYIFMLVAVPVAAILTLTAKQTDAEEKPVTDMSLLVCAGIGVAVGFYDGFFGPGTGTFLILLFNRILGMDMVIASGTAKPVNLASNAAALVSFISGGTVVFQLAVPAMLCSAAGAYIGTSLALKKGTKFVRAAMLAVMALLIVRIIINLIG